MKKILLPFNLLPHLDGTAIASCFGLKNRPSDQHTVIELTPRDTHDLLALLKALEHDLHIRCQVWQKQASKSPVGQSRRAGVEQSRQAVRRAVELIEAALAAPRPREEAKSRNSGAPFTSA
ncbi:MAG: hypothetical protein ACOZE5_04835 [Verrucomicrobiota bacterium]